MEKMKNMWQEHKKDILIIGLILIVLIGVGLLFRNNVINQQALSFLPFVNNQEEKSEYSEQIIENLQKALEEQNSDNSDENSANANYLKENWQETKFDYVYIAVLSNPDLFDYEGNFYGCQDEIAMVEVPIFPTKAILNAALQSLFIHKNDFGFEPGNFVGKQDNLKFENAVIENGVAKIYLTGEVVFNGVCDNPRLETQINATAKQFDTVKDVEIYLNGELFETPNLKD